MPQFDLGKLKAALRPLFSPQFDPVAVLHLSHLLAGRESGLAALVSRPRRLEALLMVIAAVLVGRLLVANQAFVPAELLALLLLLPMVCIMHRLGRGRDARLLVLAVDGRADHRGLAPFDFAPPDESFDFWPFLGWFEIGLPDAVQLHRLGRAVRQAVPVRRAAVGASGLGRIDRLRARSSLVATVPSRSRCCSCGCRSRRARSPIRCSRSAVGLLFRSLYQRMQPRANSSREALFPTRAQPLNSLPSSTAFAA